MNRIFLGKPAHWLLLALLVALGFYLGIERLHVRHFNLFAAVLFAAAALAVVAVLRTSAPGERVTRDPIEPPDQET